MCGERIRRFGTCSKILQSVVENLPAEIMKEVGGNATDIGTHTTRKGVASYVLS